MKLIDLVTSVHGNGRIGPINMEIWPKSVLGVVGPSGIGKTTFLRAICSTSARNFIESGRIANVAGRVAYVPQQRTLPGGYTVSKFLSLVSRGLHVDELIRQLTLVDVIDRNVDSLSGGQAQRTMIAASLLSMPKYLVMDEPFSALDYHLKLDVASVIRSKVLSGELRSAVVVSHDLDALLSVADSILIVGVQSEANGCRVVNMGSDRLGSIEQYLQSETVGRCKKEILDCFKAHENCADKPIQGLTVSPSIETFRS